MYGEKRILALVPARGGSKGIPHKNVVLLGGNPLIQYTIDAGLKSRYIDCVLVSTDDREIAEPAERCGARVPFLRPAELDRAVAILRGARKVLCMGQGGSMILASEAAHLFSICEGKYFPVADSHMQVIAAATPTEADAVLFFASPWSRAVTGQNLIVDGGLVKG